MCGAPDSSRTACHLGNRAPAVDVIRGSAKATRPEVVIMEFVLLLLLLVVGFVVVGAVIDKVTVMAGVVVVVVDMRQVELVVRVGVVGGRCRGRGGGAAMPMVVVMVVAVAAGPRCDG